MNPTTTSDRRPGVRAMSFNHNETVLAATRRRDRHGSGCLPF